MMTFVRRAALFATIVLVSTACDARARQFADRTKQILDQRSEQLAKKIAAETAAYRKAAALAAEDERALLESSLQNERNERADTLAADYREQRRPVSLWRKDLAEYARIDYTANRALLTGDLDMSHRFLQTYADLAIEQDQVDALSKLLGALANKPSIAKDLAALGTFAEETKTEFDKKVCASLKEKMAGSDAAAKAAEKAFTAKKCE